MMKRSASALIFLLHFLGAPAFASAMNPYFSQYERALQGALANVLSNGAVIASPSHSNPNYYFDWTRDTSLTMKSIVRLSTDAALPKTLRTRLFQQTESWIQWELHRQSLATLTGLGEPRFNVNGTPNHDPWGRPQNDGPALRALTSIEIADLWINTGRFNDVEHYLYKAELPANTLIKRDLEYVAHHWMEPSFDLWEEEQDLHFYTLTVQKTALEKGANLARRLGDRDAADFYSREFKKIQAYLLNFIDPKYGYIRYSARTRPGLAHKKSDLDMAVILAAIQTFDGSFHVPVKPLIETMNRLVAQFQSLYSVNSATYRSKSATPLGIALGRYPEDIYNGTGFGNGNPWFLATLAYGELVCDLKKAKALPVKHYEQLDRIAREQFNRVLYHLDTSHSMSEQLDRNSGYLQGARDLTWSYVSYITAYRACFNSSMVLP